jgi:hypothetical protein
LIAFDSIWRIRSADTLYSLASSCSVSGFSSRSQRASMMRRDRGSSLPSACERPSLRRSAVCFASTIVAGSSSASVS